MAAALSPLQRGGNSEVLGQYLEKLDAGLTPAVNTCQKLRNRLAAKARGEDGEESGAVRKWGV